MVERHILGLIKFYRDEQKLDALMSGVLYCNTPEFYRTSSGAGVADRNENAISAYRRKIDGPTVRIFLNDIDLSEAEAFTIQRRGSTDVYLHCWTLLEIPRNEAALEELRRDLGRLRGEFGGHFAFLPDANIRVFASRIGSLVSEGLWGRAVRYSETSGDWSVDCKSSAFAYQREWRFGIASCATHETRPLELRYESGFADLIYKNHTISISDPTQGVTWLELGPPSGSDV